MSATLDGAGVVVAVVVVSAATLLGAAVVLYDTLLDGAGVVDIVALEGAAVVLRATLLLGAGVVINTVVGAGVVPAGYNYNVNKTENTHTQSHKT